MASKSYACWHLTRPTRPRSRLNSLTLSALWVGYYPPTSRIVSSKVKAAQSCRTTLKLLTSRILPVPLRRTTTLQTSWPSRNVLRKTLRRSHRLRYESSTIVQTSARWQTDTGMNRRARCGITKTWRSSRTYSFKLRTMTSATHRFCAANQSACQISTLTNSPKRSLLRYRTSWT